jgi:hypothetical protein
MPALLLLILLLIAIANYIYKERLFQLVLGFFTKRYLVRFGKDNNLIFNGFNAILFVVQLLVFSLLVFFYPNLIGHNSHLLFLKIVGLLGLFFLIRYLVGVLLATLFQLSKLHKSIIFVKITYLFAISVFIFPLLIIIFYANKYNLLFFQSTLFLLVVLLIARYVFVVKNNKNMMLSGLFYFILYLCALEIAPLLLILKLINYYNV